MSDLANTEESKKRQWVQENAFNIQYLVNPSEAIQIIATSQKGTSIWYIKNPSEVVQLNATAQNGYAIQYIKNPSEAVQLNATLNMGNAIRHIENPSEAVLVNAVKASPSALMYIKRPSIKVLLIAIKSFPSIVFCNDYSKKITPAILELLHPGLANQVQIIKNLSDDEADRVSMFTALLTWAPHNRIDLPTELYV
jgi:hypothetical protein